MTSDEQLRKLLEAHGQQHLMRFWDELNEGEKDLLRKDIEEINVEEVTNFFKLANASMKKIDLNLNPVPAEVHGSVNRINPDLLEFYRDRGLKEIVNNHVGVLLLAGGRGTRLGVNYPKGMFNVKLPSNKTLFQIQAERIFKLQSLAEARYSKPCSIIWYIMTSDATMESTQKFFEKNNYFGLNKDKIVMFPQGMVPCFDNDGKILLESKNKISKSPDGNGGVYRALKTQKILQDMDKRGVKYLHAYCVDNILVKVADPVFIGYCVSKGADCGAKVVEKVSPTEPIGVICEVSGKLQVVEYSEIPQAAAEMRNPDNTLKFNAGNICNHFFTSEFLKNVANEYETKLKFHVARKKIPYVDEKGNYIQPEKPNGVKIEKFIFDVFPFACNFVTWEVPRDEEFSALKNQEDVDKDNPNTARKDIYNLHKKYIEKSRGKVIGDGPCEISPLLSYEGECLEPLCEGKTFTCPVYLSAPQEQKSQQNGSH